MVSQAIVTTREDMDVMQWKATTLFQSGLLPSHIKNANQIIAIDMMARELNIPTWQAINGINVIQGKPTVSPQLMLALIERSGKLEDIEIDSTTERCIVTMKRRGRSPHTETFSMDDAKKLKSAKWENNRRIEIALADKDNYQQQPAVMLKWRAISACARVVFPDVLMGMYTTEEIAPDTVRVDAEGDFEVIEVASDAPAAPDMEHARPTANGSHDAKAVTWPSADALNTVLIHMQRGTGVIDMSMSEFARLAGIDSADDLTAWEAKYASGKAVYEAAMKQFESEEKAARPKGWTFNRDALLLHPGVTALYPQKNHREKAIDLLRGSGLFNDALNIEAAVSRIDAYHGFREQKIAQAEAIQRVKDMVEAF